MGAISCGERVRKKCESGLKNQPLSSFFFKFLNPRIIPSKKTPVTAPARLGLATANKQFVYKLMLFLYTYCLTEFIFSLLFLRIKKDFNTLALCGTVIRGEDVNLSSRICQVTSGPKYCNSLWARCCLDHFTPT